MLRTTLLVSAIASGTFAATLAFSPAVIDVGQRLVFGRGGIVESTPVAAAPVRECAPLAKIVAALRQSRECN